MISSGFRRRVGGELVLIGLILGVIEWRGIQTYVDGTLGSRIGPIGFVLLITELGIVLTERQKLHRHERPRP